MRALAVANEKGRGGFSVAVATAFANSSVTSFPGMPLLPGTQMRVVGPSLLPSHWPVESQSQGGLLFFVVERHLSSTSFGRVDDHRVSGFSYCGYHGSAACCRSVGVYFDGGLISRINCKLRFAVIALWGAAPSGYTSQKPVLAQGQSIWSGRGSLEVSVLGSSFIRLWATERQLGRTRR